jgi:hypothetical protein
MVPLLVMVTEACPPGATGSSYGTFLSLLNLGDVVSGLITAPIVTRLKITYTDWSKLPQLLYISTASQCFVLVLVAILAIVRRRDTKAQAKAKVVAAANENIYD